MVSGELFPHAWLRLETEFLASLWSQAHLRLQSRRWLVGKKKPPPKAGAWDLLIKPGSLGVGNAAIGQGWMSIASNFFPAGVVMLAAVGELDTSFGQGCWSFVGVTSVEKSSHG